MNITALRAARPRRTRKTPDVHRELLPGLVLLPAAPAAKLADMLALEGLAMLIILLLCVVCFTFGLLVGGMCRMAKADP